MKKFNLRVSAWIFLGVTCLLLFHYMCHRSVLSDPDRYFHLHIAKVTATVGFPKVIPGFDVMPGLKESFQYPYYLFALITSLFYRLGGENAVAFVPVFLSLFLFAFLFLRKSTLPHEVRFGLFLSGLLCQYFAIRTLGLRPHILAISISILLINQILKQNPLGILIACAAYALSYHLYFFPVIFLCVGLAFIVEEPISLRVKAFGAGLVGLMIGIALHPSFPSNFFSNLASFQLIFSSISVPEAIRPIELTPVPWVDLVSRTAFFVILIFAGIWLALPKTVSNRFLAVDFPQERRGKLRFLSLLAVVFWVGMLKSARVAEYAFPIWIFLAFEVLELIPWGKSQRFSFVMIELLLLGPFGILFLLETRTVNPDLSANFEAARALPSREKNEKVFNCEWDYSPYLMYERPELGFIDFADPRILKRSSQPLFELREQLKRGELAYPYGVVRYAFGARSMVCRTPSAIENLERDPSIRRIYPNRNTTFLSSSVWRPFVFELSPTPNKALIFNFEGSPTIQSKGTEKPELSKEISWKPVKFISPSLSDEKRSPYISLLRWASLDKSNFSSVGETTQICSFFQPTTEEIHLHRGSTLVGVGGGPKIDLWFNDRYLFSSNPTFEHPHLITHFVPLGRALKSGDQVIIRVCGDKKTTNSGFSLSFWTRSEINKTCQWKGSPEDHLRDTSAPYFGQIERNCMGIFAFNKGNGKG